jgi:hypothetical protein
MHLAAQSAWASWPPLPFAAQAESATKPVMDAPNALRAVKDITKVAETMNFFIRILLVEGASSNPPNYTSLSYTPAKSVWI